MGSYQLLPLWVRVNLGVMKGYSTFSRTGASSSDGLLSHPGCSFGWRSYYYTEMQSVYSTAPSRQNISVSFGFSNSISTFMPFILDRKYCAVYKRTGFFSQNFHLKIDGGGEFYTHVLCIHSSLHDSSKLMHKRF